MPFDALAIAAAHLGEKDAVALNDDTLPGQMADTGAGHDGEHKPFGHRPTVNGPGGWY
jgi:hypothetical protein